MYEKQEHYLPITIWYLQHVAIMQSCQKTDDLEADINL